MAGAETVPGLGTAVFPTSTKSKEAQHEFMRGLLLLHVFEYPAAAKAFMAAEKLDPDFAMAYWGEAMTFNHPVWNQLDVPSGQAALKKFGATAGQRAAKIADARERAYMATVEILYSGAGTKLKRDAQYATATEQLAKSYPKDDEAQLFYALALLGENEGVRDVPVYLHGAAISKAVFGRNPDHPGAAHYWIHGMDDPQHAAQALVPARALSKIAPDAGHAQHMCSHIFMALGMWDDVVKANLAANRVVDDQDRAAGTPVVDCGHYPIWLEYGYYQQGRVKDGDAVVAECARTGREAETWSAAHSQKQPANMGVAMRVQASLTTMRGIQVVDSLPSVEAVSVLEAKSGDPLMRANAAFASGYAATEHGDAATAKDALATMREAGAEAAKKPDVDPRNPKVLDIMAKELNAMILDAGGEHEEAIAEAQHAADQYAGMAFDFGPPVTFKPPHELLGELLLKQKRAEEAKAAFAKSLTFAPRRTASLLGLARAENAMGDLGGAKRTYAELLEIWRAAEPEYAPLAEARAAVAK
jgi:tetratricopeptide (TPR) repeat protein